MWGTHLHVKEGQTQPASNVELGGRFRMNMIRGLWREYAMDGYLCLMLLAPSKWNNEFGDFKPV